MPYDSVCVCVFVCMCLCACVSVELLIPVARYGVAFISRIDKLQVSFAKEPYKRDNILQKRPIILSILLTVATP